MNAYGLTDCGGVRKENQDCFRIESIPGTEILTAVLCDGMGGAQAGATASNLAADAFMSHAGAAVDETSTLRDLKNILSEAVNYANIKVYDKSFADFSCLGMGSTLVAVACCGKKAVAVNVGDSRAYLISKSGIKQITRDHSYVESLVERGELTREAARNHPRRNIITKAIGVEASIKCDVFEMKPAEGDVILLCSDGLSNLVSDNEILSTAIRCPEPKELCEVLVDMALKRGAPDNVTVVVVCR